MKITKYTILLLFILAGLLLNACKPSADSSTEPQKVEPSKEIVFYNWTEYMDPAILEKFKQETGITISEDYFSSNEELIAKLQGGATGYALILPSDYAVSVLADEGMLAELDHNNLPNLGNINPKFAQNPLYKNMKYCVPYQWGSSGIGYNSEIFSPTSKSWSLIFNAKAGDPQYGRMTMLDDMRESFGAALIYLGYDVNTKDEKQLEEARDLLIATKPALAGYDSDSNEDTVAAGENVLSHGWNGDYLIAQGVNPNVDYFVPDEGSVLWLDGICIPATASPSDKLAAEMFINFLLDGKIGAMLSQYTYYGTPNDAAKEYLPPEYINNPIVNPSQDVLDHLQFMQPLGEFDMVYQRMWDEVKAANP